MSLNRINALTLVGSLALTSAATLTTPALAAPNNSASISCGTPSKNNKTVTVVVTIKKADGTRVNKSWTATIPGGQGYTAADKARDIVAAAPPAGFDVDGDGDGDVTFNNPAGTNAVGAQANDGNEIVGFAFQNDQTGENETHNVFAALPDTQGALGLAGVAQGQFGDGEPGFIAMSVAGQEAFIPTFPGMPAEQIELQMLELIGPAAQLMLPDQLLPELYPHTLGDGHTLMLPQIGPEGLFIDIKDDGIVLDIAGLFNVNPGVGNPCPADVDGDGVVGFTDVLTVLSSWGPCPGCPADVDGDGVVGFNDLLTVLASWGAC